MENEKRLSLILAIAIVFLAMLGSANAIPAPELCEILEKPANIEVSCSDSFVIVAGTVSEIDFLQTPAGEIDKDIFQQLWDIQKNIKEETGQKESVIPLPRWNSTNAKPAYGIYLMRINNDYTVKVAYGTDQLLLNYIYGGLLVSGVILLLMSAIIKKFTKRDKISWFCAIIGIILLVVYISTLLIM